MENVQTESLDTSPPPTHPTPRPGSGLEEGQSPVPLWSPSSGLLPSHLMQVLDGDGAGFDFWSEAKRVEKKMKE